MQFRDCVALKLSMITWTPVHMLDEYYPMAFESSECIMGPKKRLKMKNKIHDSVISEAWVQIKDQS